MTPRALTAVYVSLLAFAIALRLFFVAAIPVAAPSVAHRLESLNDEPSHYNYVKHLATHRTFPVQTHHALEPGAVVLGNFEYWQPPLYHLICAPIYAAAGERTGLYLCRLVSFLFGVLTLIVLARVLSLLDCPLSARRLAVVFVALLPPHIYFTSVVSNDSLSWLISLLLTRELLLILPGAGEKPKIPRAGSHVRTGLLLGLGLLTKGGLAIFYPVILAVDAYLAWRTKRAGVLVGGLLGLVLSTTLAAPWYARNLSVYGSLFALEVGFGPVHPEQASLAGIYHTIGGTIRFFWFPMSHIQPLAIVKVIRSWGGFIALLHTLAAAWYVRRFGLDLRGWALALLLALAIAAHFRLNFIWGEAEARFLYPALASIAFFFVLPAYAFLSRFRSGEALAWTWVVLAVLHPWILLLFASPVPLFT